MQAIENFLNSKIVFSIIVVFLVFYGPRLAPRMNDKMFFYFNNPIVRFVVVFALLYLGTRHLDKGYFDGASSTDPLKGNGRLALLIIVVSVIFMSSQVKDKDSKLIFKEPFTNNWKNSSLSDTLDNTENKGNRLDNSLLSPQSPLAISNNVDQCLTCNKMNDNEVSLTSQFDGNNEHPVDYDHNALEEKPGTMTKLWDGSVADMNSLRSYTNN
tara:strand:- start:56 stop:694 length:639 start_codon:yes stop_codon:yes gene_type:complete